MSVSYTKQSITRERIKGSLVTEVEKLMGDIREAGLDWTALFSYLNRKISRLEWMILESAYNGLSLKNLDSTLLILSEKYIEMLQNLTVQLQDVFNNATDLKQKRTVLPTKK